MRPVRARVVVHPWTLTYLPSGVHGPSLRSLVSDLSTLLRQEGRPPSSAVAAAAGDGL